MSQPQPTGTCPTCGRTYRLKNDGTLRSHWKRDGMGKGLPFPTPDLDTIQAACTSIRANPQTAQVIDVSDAEALIAYARHLEARVTSLEQQLAAAGKQTTRSGRHHLTSDLD